MGQGTLVEHGIASENEIEKPGTQDKRRIFGKRRKKRHREGRGCVRELFQALVSVAGVLER